MTVNHWEKNLYHDSGLFGKTLGKIEYFMSKFVLTKRILPIFDLYM